MKIYWWMDVYAYGIYLIAGMKYLKSVGVAPEIKEGDMKLVKREVGS